MPTEQVERRLAAADEEVTLARLKAHRRELLDPTIDQHKGRIFKTTGDGMLVEFASVIDALRCAAAVQQGMAALIGASNSASASIRPTLSSRTATSSAMAST